ncbi:hypothetical protein KPH14_010250 [Odynerus spinipes]|uniref:UBX domain-containing protein 4 n=1 Tax=Odynerus spinipes TaxID=1348599 RepID=A0AAD9RU23_9HYME|nr:hypothetical protein KPH14_010250 [Odynerus spinipes]
MKWFEGSINEAVATSKSRKAIFVVFVEGKDDPSTQFAQAINLTEVSTRLEQEDFVAIRLESGSEPYRFFAQIYHLVPVPSLFFIGENGIPLEIVAESEQKSATCNASEASTSDTNPVETPDTKVTTDIPAKPLPTTENENKLVENKSSTDIKDIDMPTTSSEAKSSNNAAELTMEEKLERAKQLIEVQKKQRQEEEERKEIERELERRKMGRDVQKMKQKQQDIEIKQAHDERMKEKAEEAAARQKVRQQIAQDKLERKQKELALQQQVQQQQPAEQPKARTLLFTDATVTRIQFRLPSGNPHMGQFSPTSTLRTLRTYVAENINLPFRQFAMSTSFPRRDLTNEDDDKTLLELELVPTAVILILPLKNSNAATTVTSAQDVSFLSRFIWSFFAPVIGIYNYLMGFFSGASHGNSDQRREDSANPSSGPSSGDAASFPNFQNLAQSTGLFRRNIGGQGGTTIRAQGNIHRLHSGGDDNDENNTWNGLLRYADANPFGVILVKLRFQWIVCLKLNEMEFGRSMVKKIEVADG